MSETLELRITRAGYTAEVSSIEGEHVLRWNDHVANEWSHHFDSLASAIIGLGVLVQAIEDDAAADFDIRVPQIEELLAVRG